MLSKSTDFQLLLYVPQELYAPCVSFYQDALGLNPFYGWDEGPEDRGVKYRVAGAVLVLLTQENPFPEYGPNHFQIEVADVEAVYESIRSHPGVKITQPPFSRSYGWRMFRMVDPAGNHINVYTVPKD